MLHSLEYLKWAQHCFLISRNLQIPRTDRKERAHTHTHTHTHTQTHTHTDYGLDYVLRVTVKQILRCFFKVMGHKMSGFVHELAVTTSTPNPLNASSLSQGRGCPPSPKDYFTSLTHSPYLSFFPIPASKMYGHTKNAIQSG